MTTSTRRRHPSDAAAGCEPDLGGAPKRNDTTPSTAALVHELRVHQVELEMQNEELRQAQVDLAAARDRFVDLYDLAPVGYLTLDGRGTVLAANLTSAAMLGEERKALLGRRFARHVSPADADRWHLHLVRACDSDTSQGIELALRRRTGELFHAQVDCLRVVVAQAPLTLRVTLTDVTQRKHSEIHRRIADSAVEVGEAERRRLARELHEELGQRLSVLKMELSGLGAGTDGASREARIAAMQDSLDDALAMVRRIAAGLRPLMLDDLGLNAAIDWLARDTARRHGMQVRLRLAELDPPLDERMALGIYRMLQEILGYLLRQARATGIGIETRKKAGALELAVQGEAATAAAPAPDASTGLDPTLALRDRAHLIGGALELEGMPGQPTRITVRLPLRSATACTGPRRARPVP